MTATVGPILQLVLSMDYSIILMNRYRQEKVTHSDKVSAMKTALAGSVSSIASSSLTTVVGLLALVFLSFKLGPELGIVLAQGRIHQHALRLHRPPRDDPCNGPAAGKDEKKIAACSDGALLKAQL